MTDNAGASQALIEAFFRLHPGEALGMDTAVTVFRADETAGEALDRIRSFPQRRIHDLCVVDGGGQLTAVLPLQEVALVTALAASTLGLDL